MATPKIVSRKSAVSDASVSTATTMASTAASGAAAAARKSKNSEASPLKRLRRKRRSSIASESTAFYSSEKTRSTGASVASFDSQSEALHKHYCYNYGPVSNGTTASEGQPATATATASEQQYRSFVHPQKETMKRHRRDKTATFGMVGAGVGTLILPVVGTVVGGVLSGYAANQSLKLYEKKMQRKWERDQFQKDASASQTARHAVFA
jgi:hypothetical protein